MNGRMEGKAGIGQRVERLHGWVQRDNVQNCHRVTVFIILLPLLVLLVFFGFFISKKERPEFTSCWVGSFFSRMKWMDGCG